MLELVNEKHVYLPMHMSPTKKRPQTIGVLPGWQAYTGSLDTFLDHVFQGILAAAKDAGCNLLFGCGMGAAYGKSLGIPAWPIHADGVDFIPIGPWNCDGLLVIPPLANDAGRIYFQGLVDSGYPILYAGSLQNGPGVVADNEEGIRQALQHIIQHGHTQIAFISGRNQDEDSDSSARLNAFLSGLTELGISINPNLIASGQHTYEGGREAMETILSRNQKFSAVIASNDQSAVGALDALRDHGLTVPGDVALIGFDDRLEAKSQMPLLTTIRFPMFEMGYQALQMLLQRIENQDTLPTVVRVPTHLVIRESCGCTPESNSTFSIPAVLLPISDEEICQKAADAVFRETQRFTWKETYSLCQQIVEALFTSLRENDALEFLSTLKQVLDYAWRKDEDLFVWQHLISILRSFKYHLSSLNQCSSDQLDDLLDAARIVVNETARSHNSWLMVQRTLAYNQVGQLTSRLFTAKSEQEILSALHENLPSLGIHSPIIGLFDHEKKPPNEQCQFYYLSPQESPSLISIKASIRHFSFIEAISPKQPFCLVAVPLRIGSDKAGFVSYVTHRFEHCAVIARQISSALQSVHLYQEVSEAKKLAEERRRTAEEAIRLKSRFLSIVSHELRAPLSLITGLTDVILKEDRSQSDYARVSRLDLERIQISAQHLDGLIRDVLDLTRMDVGQLRLSCQKFNISEVVLACNIIGKQLAEDKGLIWSSNIASDLPTIWGDKTRIQQVILNLINNALKFTARGKIELIAEFRGGNVVVAVQDSGIGVPKEEQASIFEEFHQSERSITRGYGGLGLGLAICKRIIELHGGEIGVCSEGFEGSGSTFYFTVPALIDENQDLSRLINFSYTKNIIVLGHNHRTGAALQRFFRPKGITLHSIDIATDPEWFKKLMDHRPDAILVDQSLILHMGLGILRTIRENPAIKSAPLFLIALQPDQRHGAVLNLDIAIKPVMGEDLFTTFEKYGLTTSDNADQSPTVLVVDDDPEVRDLHARIIRQYNPNIRILYASNGLEALLKLRQVSVQLVILDLIMPDLDGFSVLEAMQHEEKFRNIPVVIVTNQALTADELSRLTTSVVKVLNKNLFSIQEISERIASIITNKEQTTTDPQKRILKAIGYIHEHYHEAITRAQLASYVGLSERHLDRCFRQETGLTPIKYLNRYRIQRAKELLEKGGRDITEIALEVGFSSSGYFSRVFRDEVGLTPSKYVQRINKTPTLN